jgi:hypothetical protein
MSGDGYFRAKAGDVLEIVSKIDLAARFSQ